ncbi:hypothetical protein OAS16_06510 [Candidatus Pelagibacter sp.]|nr:hypothetical protein [Candidatus Pelagibacter sp.]
MEDKKILKKKLIFLISKPLTQRDFIRFNFEYLKKFWNIKVILISKNKFNKNIYYKFFNKNGFFIDLSYPSWDSLQIQKILKKRNYKKIKILFSDIPSSKKNYLEILNFRYFNFFNLFKKLFIIYYQRVIPIPDIVFCCGIKSYNLWKKRKIKKVYRSISFDMSISKISKKYNKKYYIFLCQNFFENIENNLIHKKRYNFNEYWNPLIKFSNYIKKKTKHNLIFLAHPDGKKKNFPKGIDVIFNNTNKYIKQSKIIFAHDSTALQMGVIYKKPITHITTNYLKNDLLRDKYIKDFAKELGNSILNIDDVKKLNQLKLDKLKINKNKYKKYMKNFIMATKSHKNIWKNFNLKILNTK